MNDERLVEVSGIQLCVQEFGDPGDPTILLISGLASSMDYWDEEFCRALATGSRHVLRYDHRDTGRSTGCPVGQPDYTKSQLVADAVGLLDAVGVGRAHLVGLSAGGGIAQEIALLYPSRVASLVLIATSPAIDTGGPLPPPIEPVRSYFADPPDEPDWTDRDAVVQYLIDGERAFIGGGFFDADRVRALIERVVDRTSDIAAATGNHWIAEPGESVQASLSEIGAPTLVLHGTADPFFPFAHAEALAEAIADARLVALDGMGHQAPPPQVHPIVVAEILRHTAR